MSSVVSKNADNLREHIMRLRGNADSPPDASIVVPVNAQGDLLTVLKPLGDIAKYHGRHRIEIILVINNYPPEQPPIEIDEFRALGVEVVAAASARRPGEVVIVSARALGVRAAQSSVTLHFDADCQIPAVTALVDWYIAALGSDAQLAYSLVGFYDYQNTPSVRIGIMIHHTVRWVKRTILKVPTTRGSNYAIDRDLFLQLYDAGKLSVDLQVGPAAKLSGAKIVYSSNPSLRVLTSGRKLKGGWRQLYRYLRYRLHYNLKATPTRKHDVTRTSWDGFNQETSRRELINVPKKGEVSGSDK